MRLTLALFAICTTLNAASITAFDDIIRVHDSSNNSLMLGRVLEAYANHLGIVATPEESSSGRLLSPSF